MLWNNLYLSKLSMFTAHSELQYHWILFLCFSSEINTLGTDKCSPQATEKDDNCCYILNLNAHIHSLVACNEVDVLRQ